MLKIPLDYQLVGLKGHGKEIENIYGEIKSLLKPIPIVKEACT
jgi:hypothetical protein